MDHEVAPQSSRPTQTSTRRRLDAFGKQPSGGTVGADGEEIVGALLDTGLSGDGEWPLIHSVVVTKGGGDIDHIVIGPPGVFTLNTKHHAGKSVHVSESEYGFDPGRRDYLDKAKSEGTNASSRLSIACSFNVVAHPVLVVVGSADLHIEAQPPGIHVVDCDGVVEWLRGLPTVLNEHQATIIAEHAADPATWLTPPPLKPSRSSSPQHTNPIPAEQSPCQYTSDGVPEESLLRRSLCSLLRSWSSRSCHITRLRLLVHRAKHSTISPTFQTVGTVTDGQCVDAWSDHDVEVLVSGVQAKSDCTRLAAPSYTANLSSGSYPTALSGPYGRSMPGDGVTQICAGAHFSMETTSPSTTTEERRSGTPSVRRPA